MTPSRQNGAHGSEAAARPEDGGRYDRFRTAVPDATGACDPHWTDMERRAATTSLIWYIEDEPDTVVAGSRTATAARA